MVDFAAYLLLFCKILLYVVSVIFFVSGLDEFFIDVYHLVRTTYRKFVVMRRYKRLGEEQLLEAPEKPIAIMIPCWDESAVIRRMLENSLLTLNYSSYHIFVGVYPNDEATGREVELVRETHANVHRVVCPKDGPTNKADCLNWIFEGIHLYEQENSVRFEIFVMEDSEDILHPLCLKLFNYLIPKKDMVQLPVIPMEKSWYEFTTGHYLDEFAENHRRDMVVRESLGRSIPSAGVGSAYSRRAMETTADNNEKQLFNVDSLTEDYDFGFRLKDLGMSQVFVRKALKRTVTRKHFFTGKPYSVVKDEFIAVREYFPSNLRAAVRQKSRWVVGIALQGWMNLGWKGGLATKYLLYRDRKALITNQANLLGNAVVPVVTFFWLHQWLYPEAYRYPPLVEKGTLLWDLILANFFFLVVRVGQRAYSVYTIAGLGQALLSFPRLFWANIINFLATLRAIRLFTGFLLFGKKISWDKTDHAFPSQEDLLAYRRRLGDLLLERRFVTVGQLDEAIKQQASSGKHLGQVLLDMGVIEEGKLLQVLGQQLKVSTTEIDPYATPLELLRRLPKNLAVTYEVYPLKTEPSGKMIIAANLILGPDTMAELAKVLKVPVEVWLCTQTDLSFAIAKGYQRLEQEEKEPNGHSKLGDILLERGLLTEEQLVQAAKTQRCCYRRLGDILLEDHAIDENKLHEAISHLASTDSSTRLGELLVQQKLITRSQLTSALEKQKASQPLLGKVLVSLKLMKQEVLDEITTELRI